MSLNVTKIWVNQLMPCISLDAQSPCGGSSPRRELSEDGDNSLQATSHPSYEDADEGAGSEQLREKLGKMRFGKMSLHQNQGKEENHLRRF